MSTIYKVLTQEKVNPYGILKAVQLNYGEDDEIACVERGNDIYYFWHHHKSTRGLDVNLGKDGVEIRNATMANKADLVLTNLIAEAILKVTSGTLVDEDNETVTQPLYTDVKIAELMESDTSLLLLLAENEDEIAIYGPVRKTYFGKNVCRRLSKYRNDKVLLAQKAEALILQTQYHLPDYGYGNVLEVEKKERPLVLKLLTNTSNCLIDKYDFILIEIENQNPLMITNGILNTILPKSWTLVDEYTIVAPVLSQNEWDEFVEKARTHDSFDEFVNNRA